MGRTGSMGGGSASRPAHSTTSGGVELDTALSKAESDAIYHYSGTVGASDLNGYLRGVRTKFQDAAALKQAQALIDSAMRKGRLAKEMTLYRGTVLANVPKVGGIMSDKAYLSTSRSHGVAQSFQYNAHITIRAPKGTRAIDVSHHAGGAESEVMLPRNTRLRVTSVKKVGSIQHVTAEVVR